MYLIDWEVNLIGKSAKLYPVLLCHHRSIQTVHLCYWLSDSSLAKWLELKSADVQLLVVEWVSGSKQICGLTWRNVSLQCESACWQQQVNIFILFVSAEMSQEGRCDPSRLWQISSEIQTLLNCMLGYIVNSCDPPTQHKSSVFQQARKDDHLQ